MKNDIQDNNSEQLTLWRKLLEESYRLREEELQNEFNRSLPFQDAMFDRWERARGLGFGEGSSIYNSAIVYGNVKVGRETWIGPYVILDGSGAELVIGSTCSIAAGVHIFTHNTVLWALSGGKKKPDTQPVRIGDCCYIGSQTVIASGVSIDSCCVVAANSFVRSNVPPNTIVGGVPAKPIGRVIFDNSEPRLVFDD